MAWMPYLSTFFFFNDTATTEIYTLSLHDALPIWLVGRSIESIHFDDDMAAANRVGPPGHLSVDLNGRSEEHTSELQSRSDLVCRLLLEKKKVFISYGSERNQRPTHPLWMLQNATC